MTIAIFIACVASGWALSRPIVRGLRAYIPSL